MTLLGLGVEILQEPGNMVDAGQAFTIAFALRPGRVFVPRRTHLVLCVTHEDDVKVAVANRDMACPFIYQAGPNDRVPQVVGEKYPVLHDAREVKWEVPNLRFSNACIGHSYRLEVVVNTFDPTTEDNFSTTLRFSQATQVSQPAYQTGGSQVTAVVRHPFSAAHPASDFNATGRKAILGAPQKQLTMGEGASVSRAVEAQPEQRKDSRGRYARKMRG